MPPIKRNQKPAAAPTTRRLAGHAGPSRQAGPAPRADRAGEAGTELPESGTGHADPTADEGRTASATPSALTAGPDAAGAGAGGPNRSEPGTERVGSAESGNAESGNAASGTADVGLDGARAEVAKEAWEAAAADAGAASAPASRDETADGPSRRGAVPRILTYAALAVGVAAGAAGIYLAFEPGISIPNEAFVDRAETDAVLTAASSNVQRLVSIDHETLDEYHDSLGEFLTPNLVDDLNENWPALRDSYEQSATTVDAQVKEAGLAYLEGDRAEVLLVQDVSMERDGVAVGSTSGTYLVGLDRVDGVWKLSRIPDLPS